MSPVCEDTGSAIAPMQVSNIRAPPMSVICSRNDAVIVRKHGSGAVFGDMEFWMRKMGLPD